MEILGLAFFLSVAVSGLKGTVKIGRKVIEKIENIFMN